MARGSMAGMTLVYRPPVRKDESILGYLYRALYTGGHVRMKDLATTLVGRQTIQPPWTVATNLRMLCEELEPVFQSAEEILDRHTCLPAHIPFVESSMRARLMAHVLTGERHPGIASAVGLAGKAIESRPKMALCPACVEEDLSHHGFAFWHREHALAGLGYCPHHGIALEVGCGMCRFSQDGNRQPLMPQLACWCGNPRALSHPEVTSTEGFILTRMAGYGQQLLYGVLNGRTPEELGAYYHLCAQRAGYADGTRIKSPSLALELQRVYTPIVLARLNAGIETEQNWVVTAMGTRVAPKILGRNLLLFDFFGRHIPNAEDFEAAAEHVRALLQKRKGRTPPRALKASAQDIHAGRATIMQYLKVHKGASRMRLLRELGPIVRRARKLDAEWYSAHVPNQSVICQQTPDEISARYWEDFDVRTSEHVLARRQQLLAVTGGYTKAITKAALLKGAPRGNEVSEELLKKLPRTKDAIASSVESRHDFKKRRALAILQQPGQNGEDRIKEAHRITGLTLSEIDRLNFTIVGRTS